ncbi:MAG: ABC transporter ATP-binding protein [Deferrisomatales bacterium]
MSVEPLIHVDEVTKVYNRGLPDAFEALHRVSLRVHRCEFVVLKGPSGSGKTSLLSVLGCMTRPTSGRVLVEGRDAAKLPERFLTAIRREIFGFVFQQFHLIRDVTVRENVLLPLYPTAIAVSEMNRRADRVLERFGIRHKSGYKVRQLSGGEQQRVAIARALVHDPAIVVADEPTAHLDAALAQEFLAILAELNGQGKTVVVASHDPQVYEHPAVGRAVELRDGRIRAKEAR